MKVLVAEAQAKLAHAVAVGLRREGISVDIALDGQQALDDALVASYDVIVLDRDLPAVHGDEVCRELIARRCESRILMLTAAATIEDRVNGLSLGADDYLPKPFAFAELVDRIRALARRPRPPLPPRLVRGDLRLDAGQRIATRAGRRLALTPKEFAVLQLLLEAQGAVTLERAVLEVALADPAATAAMLRSTCEDVLAAGQQLERLIEALLTLARSPRGLHYREAIDLAEITRNVLDAHQPQAHGLRIRTALEPALIAGDPALAERMIANLADNALRHNVVGGWVQVTTITSNRYATLLVANSGPDVPADQIQRLLLPFRRLSPDRVGGPGGSGLGLSIAGAIASAHGAAISARPGSDGGLFIEVSFAALTVGHSARDRDDPALAHEK